MTIIHEGASKVNTVGYQQLAGKGKRFAGKKKKKVNWNEYSDINEVNVRDGVQE